MEANEYHFVTVIMPIRNEADFIERSLGAILTQDYPHSRMEVLIADGRSTDSTRDVIQRLAATYPDVSLKIIDNPGRIVPTGFNLALKQRKGDIVVRVDGHTIIAPDYVRECVSALNRTGADNAGGRMNAFSQTTFGKAVALATSTPFGVGGARFHYSEDEEWVDTVYMGAWHSRVFDQIGGFDEEFVRNQDDEFNYRLRANRGRILLSPRIRSEYYPRSSPKALWRQYYQYGLYKVRVMQKHTLQMQPRHFAPVLLVAGLVVTALLAVFVPSAWVLFSALAGLYAIANLVASTITAFRSEPSYIFILPVVFAILHFSYGTGFAVGLVRFAGRWREGQKSA
ncbi:MAG TPA: glycosyltransferase family 2 protein [Tabrizicola sp.]|nr:glycosyltransferase family 2 protein [Tabrizicola sp.]